MPLDPADILTRREQVMLDALLTVKALLGTGECEVNPCEACAYEVHDCLAVIERALLAIKPVTVSHVP